MNSNKIKINNFLTHKTEWWKNNIVKLEIIQKFVQESKYNTYKINSDGLIRKINSFIDYLIVRAYFPFRYEFLKLNKKSKDWRIKIKKFYTRLSQQAIQENYFHIDLLKKNVALVLASGIWKNTYLDFENVKTDYDNYVQKFNFSIIDSSNFSIEDLKRCISLNKSEYKLEVKNDVLIMKLKFKNNFLQLCKLLGKSI
ncbi:hypothetical protein [[Mycoplasma] testudinis]|uniref:hypothetical protein n=1 Tax=[Mycoplasma] testudinis TaxID=33924 RepID=UPI000481335E|nr:hypothetical protein [[Mycoplasma] testudinis]